MKTDPLVNYQAGPFGGPFSIAALLADSIAAVPYEGLWVPTKWAKSATVELFGSISTLSLDIWGTNQQNPLNTYTVTVGGTETDGDVLTLNFSNPLLPNGGEAVVETTAGGEGLPAIATGLAAAINANTALGPLGFTATAAADVVTIQWPSVPGTALNTDITSPPFGSNTILTASKSGGATETLTIGVGADGANLTASHLIALGLTAITPMPVLFTKARVTTLTGSGANVTAALAATP